MRRIPPPLWALAATLAVIGIVVALFVATGAGGGRKPPACTAALSVGPYGCVVFESVSGTLAGADQPWLANGTASYRVLGDDGRFTLSATGGCNGITWTVAVNRSGYRVTGPATSTLIGCAKDKGEHDGWIEALFAGSPKVVEHDDATVTVTNGPRVAVFQEVVAQG